jgi:tetratricopeptide (TPR) repeat protein
MPQTHLHPRLFEKLLSGDVTIEEVRELVWHLMETCPDCAQGVEVDWKLSPPGGEETGDDCAVGASDNQHAQIDVSSGNEEAGPLDEIFDRLSAKARETMRQVDRDRAIAPALVDELVQLPAARQRLVVHNTSKYHTLPVAELLLERAWAKGFDEPKAADSLAGLSLDVIERTESEFYGQEILSDARGRAWALRGNFNRILGDLREAEGAFARAHGYLKKGTGDLLERARLLTLESTLLRVQLRQEDASRMLDEVVRIYRLLDERHLVGRTMINQAHLLDERGESGKAILVLREAQTLIDPEREPRLVRVVQHNLVMTLSNMGHYEEAMTLVPALRRNMVQDGSRADLLRLRWQEGRIHLGLGNDARAEAAFLEVRKGMEELEFAYDVAVVSLELAALYTRQRRTGEIRELAAQMFPIFQSRDLHQEAIAALLLFQRAVEMDTLTLRMVEEVADVVRRSQERPRPQSPEPS